MLLEGIAVFLGTLLGLHGLLSFWPVEEFYQIYRPILLFLSGYALAIGILFLFYELVSRLISNEKKEYTTPNKFARFLLQEGITFINYHARIKVRIKGKEKIPHKSRFLIVCNHKSKFDPMIITSLFGQKDIAFLTKRENMQIPMGGKLMHRLCYLPLDREDKMQSLEQMKKAESLIERNVSSVGVFPEGKRMDSDVILGDFHEGVFNIAIRSKCPIVVATFKGTENIHKNFPKKATKVDLNILAVISFDEYDGKPAKRISDEIHAIMYESLSR